MEKSNDTREIKGKSTHKNEIRLRCRHSRPGVAKSMTEKKAQAELWYRRSLGR